MQRRALILLIGVIASSACSDRTPVAIQPGSFTEAWPTVLRGELVKNKRCTIDQINGQSLHHRTPTFKSGEILKISGWAFSKDETPTPVYVQLVGPALTYVALAQTRLPRPDINQYFHLDPSWNAGFELEATQKAEPGEYQIEIWQPGQQGIAQCQMKAAIKIDPPSGGA